MKGMFRLVFRITITERILHHGRNLSRNNYRKEVLTKSLFSTPATQYSETYSRVEDYDLKVRLKIKLIGERFDESK